MPSTEAPARITDEDWEQRYSFGIARYDAGGEKQCWRMWHPDLVGGPFCHEPLRHEGDHKGFGLVWSRSPRVSPKTADCFLSCYRSIPNNNHEITLRDDGTVTMTLRAFGNAVRFIRVHISDDD